MSKLAIMAQLDEMEQKLDDTVSGMQSGPVRDAMKLVVPMMKDQIVVMRGLLEEMDTNRDLLRG